MGIVSLKSNLAINGTPERYDTKGVLGNVDDPGGQRVNYSQLDIDKTPERYNTAGKLASLDDKSSNLNFDGALPAQADNFTNTNANGFTIQNPVGVTQFINDGQTSVFGRLGTPERYDIVGKLGFLPAGSSRLDFDSPLPAPVDNFDNITSKGFTIKNPVGISQFIGILGNTYTNPNGIEIINTPGIGVDNFNNGNARGFTIKNPVGISQFVDGGQTSQFGFIGSTAPSVDFFTNTFSNGFNIKNPIGISRFIGIQGNTYTNPNGTIINTTPGQGVDFIPNIHAKGFIIKNPVGVTQFNGITGTQFINPAGKNLINTTPGDFGVNYINDKPQKNFIIKQARLSSNFVGINGNTYTNPTGNRLGLVNFFPNESSGATGFKDKLAPYETGFIGISADNTKYQYPDTVKGARLLNVAMGSALGTAKLENQLGIGSKLGNTGFYAEKRYGEEIRNNENKSFLMSWALKRNSPSPLDNAYTYSTYYGHDLKLRSTAFNPTYMAQPYVLRGLQNPDFLSPQRWGLTAGPNGQALAGGLVAALDGGFIRGGASTAVERAAIDTARIAKFMASPKGLVWVITQIGLGKSNPLVEKNPENVIPFNDTRSHSGLTTLLSVPGTAFGLHFTRHGIPFLNEAASYEKVIQYQTNNWSSYSPGNYDKSGNRLAKIKKELFGSQLPDPDSIPGARGLGQRVSNAVKGSENPVIQTISGLGGPGSVYGIGSTNIRRYVDTSLKKQLESKLWSDDIKREFIWFTADTNTTPDLTTGRYSIIRQYAPTLNQNRTFQGTITEDKENAKNASIDNVDWQTYWAVPTHILLRNSPGRLLANLQGLKSDGSPQFPSTYFEKWNPGNGQITKDGPRKGLNKVSANNTNTNSGNTWNTLPYVEIRKTALDRKPGSTVVNDFRKPLLVTGEENQAASNLIPLDKKLENTIKSYEDKDASWTPGNRGATVDNAGANKNINSYADEDTDAPRINRVRPKGKNSFSGNSWNVLPYQELRNIAASRSSLTTDINDFQAKIENEPDGENLTKHPITNPEISNYRDNNLRDYYGFGNQGVPGADRTNPYEKTEGVGNIDDTVDKLKNTGPHALAKDSSFRGDRVNAIDYIRKTSADDIYTEGAQDFIKFYFAGIKLFDATESDAIVFRATIKGLADSFSPGWSTIQVMGRPDGPAMYNSFERNISFNFTAAATSREELVPMWRKLNYLGSYTMPIYGGGKPGGALCRMTIGDMFVNTPGYFTGLTISVNDEATWDLANDNSLNSDNTLKKFNKGSKQLPNLVDVDVQFKILHDWRPQKGGRVYYLYNGNYTDNASLQNDPRSWLWDSNI